jgi:hypothetical protein
MKLEGVLAGGKQRMRIEFAVHAEARRHF